MERTDYLNDEMKRLNRINDLLEKEANKGNCTNLAIYEVIQKNTSTMCKIAEVI